jgi:hypothetical protein
MQWPNQQRSLPSTVLGLNTLPALFAWAAACGAFTVIGFLNFSAWLCHGTMSPVVLPYVAGRPSEGHPADGQNSVSAGPCKPHGS